MTSAPAQVAPADARLDAVRLLSVTRVAELLAIDRSSVYRLLSQVNDPLPSVKLGGCRRIPLKKLGAWVERRGNGR